MQSVEFTRAYSALKRGKEISISIYTTILVLATNQINKAVVQI